ncbi:MAG TPA: NAD(P)H-quinone oxidoreductase [Myxococcota bacterium]|nr:NAD(P)H-quinone oxidoreductase [Myxococcota bacterium]
MRAIQIVGEGKDARLVLGEAPKPELRAGELRIQVAATAVNRADLMQRRGLYPPPPGASPVLGLECAGTVIESAPGVTGFARGERVMALLAGGGYAEEACVDAGSVMPVPQALSLEEAAGIPEVFLTCHLNLFQLAHAPAGGWALVHGGGSGIGTAAIQLLRAAGVHSIVTAGSAAKCARCLELGADVALDYTQGDFAPAVLEKTGGAGVDVVLDSIGGPYLAQHLTCMKLGGRLVLIGLMGGARAEANLGLVVAKRLSIIGSTLRARPIAEKAEIVRGFRAKFGAALESGKLRPIVDRVLPLAEAQAAHDCVEASSHFGKVVLKV